MVSLNIKTDSHPKAVELANYLSGSLPRNDKERVERHLGSCNQCLDSMVAAYDSVKEFNKKGSRRKLKDNIIKRVNIYLLLAAISFIFSFVTPRYFIQLLVATLLLGIKWVADSKSTKMLVMIHEAWKRDGAKGASDALKTLEEHRSNRL